MQNMTYLLFIVEQRRGKVVSNEPLLAFHDDVAGRVVFRAAVGRPDGGGRARLEFHGAVELEYGLLVACLAMDLVAAQALLLLRV